MNKTSMRILAIGLPLAAVATTGAALAYWSSTGSATGTSSTQAGVASLTVVQASAPTNLAPGVAAGGVTVTVTNPTGSTSDVKVSQVVASIASVVKATDAPAGTCAAADYTLAGATMTAGAKELIPGGSTTFSGATLAFNNTTADQNGCKGATVTLSYAAS